MEKATKEKILSWTAQTLDEVDSVMEKIHDRFNQLEQQAQEASKPHLEKLRAIEHDMQREFVQLKHASDDVGDVVKDKVADYVLGFRKAYEDLIDSASPDGDIGEWSDIPPPTLQLGHPNPTGVTAQEHKRPNQ